MRPCAGCFKVGQKCVEVNWAAQPPHLVIEVSIDQPHRVTGRSQQFTFNCS
ncbi:hypothetical protein BX591_10794 [Paraburkholderia bryophila]|uniref:Uncharacterized protein n=1 Tax=Paraburkholderia bryophila TaxID=420952 RepID=A0A329CGS0_9BURK|nr:hypothetical protein BX591_10794 [Paraburkholderia bryophila]